MLSVGTIVGGAFGLIRDRLGSVLVWGLLYTLAAFAIGYFMMSSMASMMTVNEDSDPAVALGVMGGFFGRLMLLYFVFFCFYTVLLTAAQRAVLRPEEGGFAYLRFGGDELRQIGLGIVVGIMFFVVYLVAAFILAIVVGVGAAGGGGGGGAAIVMLLGIIGIFCLLLFLWVRVSLAFPLTLLRGRIVLGEAWRLSRGHFWTMFGGYLVLILIVIAITITVSLIVQGGYWAELMRGGMMDPAAQQAQMEAQYSFGPAMILSLLFGAAVGGLMIALTGGAIASAARALDADHEGMARTFA